MSALAAGNRMILDYRREASRILIYFIAIFDCKGGITIFVFLFAILIMVLILPFFVGIVERNLEIFLFIMGLLSTIVSRVLGFELISDILKNHLIYMLTAAVLIAGFLFKYIKSHVRLAVNKLINVLSVKGFIFLMVVFLGLAASIITAIITALLLVEIVVVMPLDKKKKIDLTIVSCFAIGLGAVLTPIGEPLSTIITSKLGEHFWFLFELLGIYILPGIVALGIFGAFFCSRYAKKAGSEGVMEVKNDEKSNKEIVVRAAKIFLFVVALELLGAGFKPIIDTYVIHMGNGILYWLNMISAILDNATLAAAEISVKMSLKQITAILMGLLISGGMLIPGNIPNIVSAQKLKIRSKEWAKLGLPLGLVIMAVYYVVLFVI